MNGARRGMRRVIGLGLLMPGLLFVHPPGAMSETKPPPRSTQKSRPAKSTKAEPSRVPAKPSPGRCVYVVKRGDSLSQIAVKHKVSRSSVMTTNHLSNPNSLRVGQRLQIPGCQDAAPPGGREPETASIAGDKAQLLARVGPRRIPTQLHLAVPDFNQEGVELEWPIDGPVVSEFGRRRRGWHAGIDIRADPGTPIRAAARGTVIFSGFERYYGRMIRIAHADGFTTLYAHNLENLVEAGDDVEGGAVIATVGRTGHASGEHLHFEIRRHGVAYNPLHLLGRETPVLASTPPPLEMAPPTLDVAPPSDVIPPFEDEEDRE